MSNNGHRQRRHGSSSSAPTSARQEYYLPPPAPGWPRCKVTEIGTGPFCYVRDSVMCDHIVVFRFATQSEVDAAIRKGMELDHVRGAGRELVRAIHEAAARALD